MDEQETTKLRLFLCLLALLTGVVLVVWGAVFGSISVIEGPAGAGPPIGAGQSVMQEGILALSQFALITDVTIGGVVRWDSGHLQRTYGGDVKPGSLCPT